MNHRLQDLLASTPGIKRASVEMPNKQQYENDFGKMAYTFLQDRIPQMIPHLVGFEVVEQEPDGARSVGMFGFRVGERFYYVPVFFINNQIKGMESIYDRQSDIMAPLAEDTVNDIINRKSIEIGGPAEGGQITQDMASPDLSVVARPPMGGRGEGGYKYASAVMEDMCDVWNDLQKKAEDMLANDPEFQTMFANAIISQTGGEIEKSASNLTTYLTYAGGPQAVARLFGELSNNKGFAKAAMAFYSLDDLAITDFDQALAPKQAAAEKIEIITTEEDFKDMGEQEGTKLLSQGFVLKDNREEDEKSDVYSYEPKTEVVNPTKTGVYNVALAGGRVEKCLVLQPSVGKDSPHMVIVRSLDSDNYFTASSDRIFIVGSHEDENDITEALDKKTIELKNAKDNTLYALVNKEGKTSFPFRIDYSSSKDRENITFKISWSDYLQYTGSNTHRADNRWVRDYSGQDTSYISDGDELVLRPGKGMVKELDGSYIVPTEDWSLLTLEKDTPYDYACAPCDGTEASGKPEEKFCPASYTEVTENLIKDAMHEVRVDAYDSGSAFLISLNGMKDSREPVTLKTASVRLVRDFGMPVPDTEILLKEAATKYKSTRMVKFAQQVQMPMMQQPPAPYADETGVPVQQFYDNAVEGHTAVAPAQPGQRTGGEAEMQQQMAGGAAGLAEEAAAMGQQQVFDHASISGLADTSDSSALVDTFIPTWIESLDKLGRTLFLFYWKNDEFAERYGSDDIADLEDKLRNVYHKFGELVYELKNKTIGAQAGDLI